MKLTGSHAKILELVGVHRRLHYSTVAQALSIKDATAKRYLRDLERAGYLDCAVSARLELYTLSEGTLCE